MISELDVRAALLPPIQASKWLRIQLLIDAEEMRALFAFLGDFSLYATWRLTTPEDEKISTASFLEVYRNYVEALKNGTVPDDSLYRGFFSSAMTLSPQLLYAVGVNKSHRIIRAIRPVIQLQPHTIGYSSEDETFRSMVLGTTSMTWGIQFSYPQLFQDPETKEIVKVDQSPPFPNTALFRRLQHFVREHTVPTPFIVGHRTQTVSQRIGKQAFSWIHRHPQLVAQQIGVKR